MVIKKSNSPFNSGATQRVCNMGGYKKTTYTPSQLTLSITLQGLPSFYNADNPSAEHVNALNKIYNYLDFPGPDLKSYYEGDKNTWRWWEREQHARSFYLNKKDYWLLPEKIENLMKEKRFVDGQDENMAEIRVVKVSYVADSGRVHKKDTCVLREEESEENNETGKKKKKRINKHSRGMQRRHLLPENSRPNTRWDTPQGRRAPTSNKKVIVELREKDQVDTRALDGPESDTHWERIKMKSLSKSKGCKYGRDSYHVKGYHSLQIKEDRLDVFCDYHDDYVDWLDDSDCFQEDWEVCDYGRRTETSCEGWDISHSNRRRHNKKLRESRCTRKTKGETDTESNNKIVKVDAASFGSFRYSDDVLVDVADKDELEKDGGYSSASPLTVQEIQESVQIVVPVTADDLKFDTRDNFVQINLRLPDDFHEKMMDSLSLSNSDSFHINGCPVVLGNCYPPVFNVKLQGGGLCSYSDWDLVVISSHAISSQHFVWEVTLKSRRTSLETDSIKDYFYKGLYHKEDVELSLNDLVDLAINSIDIKKNEDDKIDNANSISVAGWKGAKLSPSWALKYDNLSDFTFSSVEDTFKLLEISQCENSVVDKDNSNASPSDYVMVTRVDISYVDVDCDICYTSCDKYGAKDSGIITLLPCNHSFCHDCWQAHMYCSLKNGEIRVKCMHTGCKEHFNDTAMSAFVPEKDLNKLQSQRRERRIEMSPLCQWCPKSICDTVAMINSQSPHTQQFGCAVLCQCSSSWCFSCQSAPHWPASCAQMAVHRKLVQKWEGDHHLSEVASCDIQLKPCPGCKYPIEKNEGCPHMSCRMCDTQFCWKCLQPVGEHQVWLCTVDENSNFVSYTVENKVINSFPLKFFRDSVEMVQKSRHLKRQNADDWLRGLHVARCRKMKAVFDQSTQGKSDEIVKQEAITLASETLEHLRDSYGFLENFYLLLSFAILGNGTEDKIKKKMLKNVERLAQKLVYVNSKLESRVVVGQNYRQVFSVADITRYYLDSGRETMNRLLRHVALVQRMSKDVKVEPFAELDPQEHFRYN